jgi:hypothetical protein
VGLTLSTYTQQVQTLLADLATQFYLVSNLTNFINAGRSQIAIQSECLIANATFATMNGAQAYALTSITPPANLSNAINVRSIRVTNADTTLTVLESRSWQWFQNYYLNGAASIATGTPKVWAQQTQGVSGSFSLSPIPSGTSILNIEASWVPVPLVNDTTVDVLPYPWTDAVQFYACYLAYIGAQRGEDAKRMLGLFNSYMKAAREGVTPEWNATNFPMLKQEPGQVSDGGEGGMNG